VGFSPPAERHITRLKRLALVSDNELLKRDAYRSGLGAHTSETQPAAHGIANPCSDDQRRMVRSAELVKLSINFNPPPRRFFYYCDLSNCYQA